MRILLIDDHALVRKGLEELLRSRGLDIVASVGDGAEGVRLAQSLVPDVILLDVKMPGLSGPQTLERLRSAGVGAPVLMLTMSRDDADLRAALRAGADGYLLKDMDPEDLLPALNAARAGDKVIAQEMVGALTRIAQGSVPNPSPTQRAAPFSDLTPREFEILTRLAEGLSNKLIARALNITDGTVKLHVKSILRKLGVRSRVEAAVMAVEHGLGKKNADARKVNT